MSRDRLQRLADSIRALADKDLKASRQASDIANLRCKAASQLYAMCAGFAAELNEMLHGEQLRLDPASYGPEDFRDSGPNLIQLNVRGRIVQIEFAATPALISTEDFRVPYILEGAVRSFNQPMLEQNLVEEHLLFYCLEAGGSRWRFFDARTYSSGVLDTDYLVSVMEKLM